MGMLVMLAFGGLHVALTPLPAVASCVGGVDPCCDSLSQTDNPDGTVSVDYGELGCDPNYRPSLVWLGIATFVLLGGIAFVSYQVVQSRRERVT